MNPSHSRAAPMPRRDATEAASCAEIVERVPKLTSFSISACTRAAEMDFTAAAMAGSASV